MSEEETQPKPEKAVAKAKNDEPEAPAPIPAGFFGALLEKEGFTVTHLGNDAVGTEAIQVDCPVLLGVAKTLRDHSDMAFDLLLSVSGVDMKDHRLSVTHLYSLKTKKYLTIKTPAQVDAEGVDRVPSLMPVWHAADWHEREAYDLMGIHYDGHEDLKRILMPMDWVGYPLRKDYVENDPRLVWNRR